MERYYDYLAVQVLNEKQIVTYRSISRALKVHVNLAKQMLWEFHHQENERKAGCVHATYLLMGRRRTGLTRSTKSSQRIDGEDTSINSSPPLPGSSMPISEPEPEDQAIVQRSMVLAKEEDLEEVKSTFEDITSIHLYSIEPDGLDDFQLLTECNRKVLSSLRTDDLLAHGKRYGLIQNPAVKRRERKTALPPAPVIKNEKASSKPGSADAKEVPTASKPAVMQATKPQPPLLKKSSSGIAASFAKGANKPKAVNKVPPAATKDVDGNTSMGGVVSEDDDDHDDADAGEELVEIEVNAPGGKSKKDRQAELEAMMDVDDEVVDEPEEEEPSAPIEAAAAAAAPVKEEPHESAIIENGRRRGRRRVMRKKTVRDEEGYLVTKEEAVWESFSEDEPEPKKIKPTATAGQAPAAKKAGKPGQGNIMSFFTKK